MANSCYFVMKHCSSIINEIHGITLSFFLSLLYLVPQITAQPDSLENVTPGKPAEFGVKAIGKDLTYTWHRQTAEQFLPNDKRVFIRNSRILHIEKVEPSNEGHYVCTISSPTGGSVETTPAQLTASMQLYNRNFADRIHFPDPRTQGHDVLALAI